MSKCCWDHANVDSLIIALFHTATLYSYYSNTSTCSKCMKTYMSPSSAAGASTVLLNGVQRHLKTEVIS